MAKDALKVVLIGGSAGSIEVLMRLIPALPWSIHYALVLVLHRKSSEEDTLEELLTFKTDIPVIPIEDKQRLEPGKIFVTPGDYHLLFEESGELSLDASEKVNYSRPSIDVSFEDAAKVYGENLTAILLSGANADGTAGLSAIQKNNGKIYVQHPDSAEMPFMPQNAIDNLTPVAILDIDGLIALMQQLNS